MAPNVKFFKGDAANLPSQQITSGQVYFVISDEQGSIYFDNGNKRYQMSGGVTSGYATCSSSSLADVKIITLSNNNWIPSAGSSLFIKFTDTNKATGPVFTVQTLDGNVLLQNIPVFYQNKQILLQDLDRAGSQEYVLEFVYDGDKFNYISGFGDESKGRYYDINHKDYKIGDSAISAHNLIGQNMSGDLVPIALSSFMIGTPIYISDQSFDVGVTGNKANLYNRHYNILINHLNQEFNGEPYSQLYLKGTVSHGVFTPDTNPFAFSLPTEKSDFCYLYIGDFSTSVTFAGNHSYISLNSEHPIYTCRNGRIEMYCPPVELEHSLTIGEHVFDGTRDVVVPIYKGDIN